MSEIEFQPPALEELADLLPAYEILSFIAAGGMGAVYHATQKSLDREVAIKILPREFGADEEFRTQFAAEAKAMAKLNHPNLISVYDFGEVDGMPFLVMEFVNGNSLYYSAYEKAIEQMTAATITLGIAEGLAHAHKAGILHRDIKPANIFLNSDAEPKIGDFGLARPTDHGEAEGPIFGTPGYTAPEVTMDPASVGTQADVFSLGVILYELLTGERPDEDNYVPVYRKVQADRRFDQIVQRAIHPSPSERYENAGEMADDLRRLADTLGSVPAPKTLISTAPEQSSASGEGEPNPATAPVARPVSSSSGSWQLMRNLVLIVVLAGAVFGVWKAIGHKKTVEEQKEKEHHEQIAIQESFEKADVATNPPSSPPEESLEATDPDPPTESTEPEIPAETTSAALARLQPKLAAGDLSELPAATISRGNSRYLFVETPMTWLRASQFALAHGAHLATCPDNTTRGWLSSKLPGNSDAWVGAGTIDRNIWGWVDGSSWNFTQFSSAKGTAAALSDLGTIRAHVAGIKFPFLIQWRVDASNPGTVEAQLKRALAARDTPNPYWPPGSFHQDKRHFALVPTESSFSEAEALASKFEGHLAVITTKQEAKFVAKALNEILPEGSACWLGGLLDEEGWKWINDEPWEFTQWRKEAPDGDPAVETALRYLPGAEGGWDDAHPDDRKGTPFVLIEWSTDHQDYLDSLDVPAPESLLALRKMAKEAFIRQEDSHREALIKNAKDYRWELDDWFRQLTGNQRERFTEIISNFKAAISNNGVISDEIPRSGATSRIITIAEDRIAKQGSLEREFIGKLEKLRRAYLKKLEDELKAAQISANRGAIKAYENEIEFLGENGNSAKAYFESIE